MAKVKCPYCGSRVQQYGKTSAGRQRWHCLACGEHPVVHNDRGCHYRWPGWVKICEENGLVRSMSRKGCSPDNSAMEGFFGRMKVEMFYGRSWKGVSITGFMEAVDSYIRWYNSCRIKVTLGGMSPLQYRESLGIAA